MKLAFQAIAVALLVRAVGSGQPSASPKLEFDAVAIRAAAPQTGHFHSAPASSRGGPGTADPTMFGCSNCNLAFLISKAFELERYQFPGQSSLTDTAFDISARVPEGTTPEQFLRMLQSLLSDRFSLSYHYEKKQMQGYELVVAKNGPKLKESNESGRPAAADTAHREGAGNAWHGGGSDGPHELTRPGLMFFNGQGKYRGERRTMGDLARMISNQLAKPVDDHTGLSGTYDISLSWSDDGSHAASHAAGGGAWDHGDRVSAAQGGPGLTADNASGPTLFGALQAQLGLKLEARRATGNIFVIDRVDKAPTAN